MRHLLTAVDILFLASIVFFSMKNRHGYTKHDVLEKGTSYPIFGNKGVTG